MMLDDLRLYGAAFSKNGKRIPPEDVYITQPPAPAVNVCACGVDYGPGHKCQRPAVQIAAPGDVERRARELLADAPVTRHIGHDFVPKVFALRAISAALRSQGQADAVDAKDAARYRWLRRHYGSVNFDPIDHDGMDLVFSVPQGEVSANCDKTIDGLAQQANKDAPKASA